MSGIERTSEGERAAGPSHFPAATGKLRYADGRGYREDGTMNDSPNSQRFIICVDFDGVLHSYDSGWKGATLIPDPPVDGAIEFLRRASRHFNVNIYSSRSHYEGGIEAMKSWLAKYGGDALVQELFFPKFKPPAKVTIDDRAITFNGPDDWPSIEELLEFEPWNKK
jgi:hypothetical protein